MQIFAGIIYQTSITFKQLKTNQLFQLINKQTKMKLSTINAYFIKRISLFYSKIFYSQNFEVFKLVINCL